MRSWVKCSDAMGGHENHRQKNRIGPHGLGTDHSFFGFGGLIASTFMITNNFGLGYRPPLACNFALLTTFTVFVVLMLRMELRRETFTAIKRRITNTNTRRITD